MKKIIVFLLLITVCFLTSCDTGPYVVKFIGLDDKLIESKTVYSSELIVYPEAPVETGYEFLGWDTEATYTSSNLVIKAAYKKLKYEVKFYDQNDNLIDTQLVEYDTAAKSPNSLQIEEGFELVGWDKDIKSIKENLEVRPIIDRIKLTVKFYDFDKNLVSTKTVLYGESVLAPSAPIVEDYEFIGWSENLTTVKENLDVYPLFEKNKFSVIFYDNDGDIISSQKVTKGESAKAPNAPIIEGYKFVGWNTSFEKVTEDLEIYPNYEEYQEKMYLVSFYDMYGELLYSENVLENTSANPPIPPVVPCHSFVKWDKDYLIVKSNLVIKAVYQKNNSGYLMTNVNYWLQSMASKMNITKEILKPLDIEKYNDNITSDYSKTKVVDVKTLSQKVTSSYVSSMITRYTNISKYTVYNDQTNAAINQATKDEILLNRNLSNIDSEVEVKFGLVTNFAWMRSYPTNYYSNDYDMDRFQETSLNVGEGVAVYHESIDGKWYFVQAENYNGWVEKKNIALCSFDEMSNFLTPDERLVVISDYVMIEDVYVRMGQVFPLLENNDSSYKVSFPFRNSDGTLLLKDVEIAHSSDYSVGYLPYTYENIYKQGYKLVGIEYSWGDKNKDGRDCSSTMNAIYKCFGFMMPRNTSNQVAIPTYGKKVNGVSNLIMQTYQPGTLIFTSSHVMMYLGCDANGKAFLLHNTNNNDAGCILQALDNYGPSKINGILELQ